MSKYSLGRQLLYPIMKEKERERESYRAGHNEFDLLIRFEL